jgi:hypothetical protein
VRKKGRLSGAALNVPRWPRPELGLLSPPPTETEQAEPRQHQAGKVSADDWRGNDSGTSDYTTRSIPQRMGVIGAGLTLMYQCRCKSRYAGPMLLYTSALYRSLCNARLVRVGTPFPAPPG